MPFRTATAGVALVCIAAGGLPATADEAAHALGRTVFLETADPACAICHTLADAGAAGEVGPSLDDLRPDAERIKAAVENGVGIMPAFEDLTAEEIAAVAAYVAAVAGR